MGHITEEEQRQTVGSFNMHAIQRHESVGRAALCANAAFESSSTSQLLLSLIPVSPCKHKGELSDESQPHAHADRQEGRERREIK